MKRWFANLLLRLAFRIFRRYHKALPKEVNEIIWGEITRDPKKVFTGHGSGGFNPDCSTCVREAEEDRDRQTTMQRWLSGSS